MLKHITYPVDRLGVGADEAEPKLGLEVDIGVDVGAGVMLGSSVPSLGAKERV